MTLTVIGLLSEPDDQVERAEPPPGAMVMSRGTL